MCSEVCAVYLRRAALSLVRGQWFPGGAASRWGKCAKARRVYAILEPVPRAWMQALQDPRDGSIRNPSMAAIVGYRKPLLQNNRRSRKAEFMSEFAKQVLPVALESEMRESYLAYAMSVIVGRALPDVRDGLKPVHRRVLFAMNISQRSSVRWLEQF